MASCVAVLVNTLFSRTASRFRLISALSASLVFCFGAVSGPFAADSHSASAAKKTAIPATAHSEHHPAPAVHKPAPSDRPAQLLVVLIGGMDSDPTPRQIAGTAVRKEGNSGLYRLRGDLRLKKVIPEYFNWNGSRAGALSTSGGGDVANITRFIESHLAHFPHDRVAIVGNSWGGHTAWEVITQLRERHPETIIQLAVFLDGSSTGRARLDRKGLPTNVAQSLNIYTRNTFVWGSLPPAPRQENIDLGDPAQGFLRQPGPAYDATLNFKAHVSAEWDEEIHALIRSRLLAVVPKDQSAGDQKAVHQSASAHSSHDTPAAPLKKSPSSHEKDSRGGGDGGAGY